LRRGTYDSCIVFKETCTLKLLGLIKAWKIFCLSLITEDYYTVRKIVLKMEFWERLWYDLAWPWPSEQKPNQVHDFDCSYLLYCKERFSFYFFLLFSGFISILFTQKYEFIFFWCTNMNSSIPVFKFCDIKYVTINLKHYYSIITFLLLHLHYFRLVLCYGIYLTWSAIKMYDIKMYYS